MNVTVKVWGELACFTRPEMKVERMSYPVMTPSAARGVLDAILWKPQMTWHVRRITVLPPVTRPHDAARPFYELVSVRRNEISSRISTSNAKGWMADPELFEPYLVDSASSGQEKPAVFLADTIARVLPVQRLIDEKARAKFDAQRSTFWRFVDHVAVATNDPALRAMQHFGEWLKSDVSAPETLAQAVEAKELTTSHLCTFAWLPDENTGQPILAREAVRKWWREFFAADRLTQETDTFRGRCQVTDTEAAIPSSIKTKINGLVSIGCRADAYLVTAVDASGSYGLEGAATGMVSAQGIDGFTRALNALIANQLPGQTKSCVRVGGTMLLFWARDKDPTAVLAFETANTEEVARLIRSAEAGRQQFGTQENDFYCLTLSGNSSRVVVFKHASSLGSAPAHLLFDRVKVPDLGPDKPPRKFGDYTLTVDAASLPAGITIHELPEQLDQLIAPLT